MQYIAAGQIRAARGMLDWSREELAREADLSPNTIRKLEEGNVSLKKTMEAVRRAFENAGILFTEEEGIRRERMDVKVLKGAESCDAFFETLFDIAKRKGGEIIGAFKTQEMMIKALGIPNNDHMERLEKLKNHAGIRCVLADEKESNKKLSQCRTRVVPGYCVGHSYFVYGNRYAIVQRKGSEAFQYIIQNDVEQACHYREHFEELWDLGGAYLEIKGTREKESVGVHT